MALSRFASRVQDLMDEQQIVREGLWYEGPKLIERLCGSMSLRCLAARINLSATYLCQVRHSQTIISHEAFVRLAEVEAELKKRK